MKILRIGPGPKLEKPPIHLTCHDCTSLLELTVSDTLRVVHSKGLTSHVVKCANCNQELWVNAIRFQG